VSHTFLRFFDSDPAAAIAVSTVVEGIGEWLLPLDGLFVASLLESWMCCGSSLRLVSDAIAESLETHSYAVRLIPPLLRAELVITRAWQDCVAWMVSSKSITGNGMVSRMKIELRGEPNLW
jgi:hypothetical protein